MGAASRYLRLKPRPTVSSSESDRTELSSSWLIGSLLSKRWVASGAVFRPTPEYSTVSGVVLYFNVRRLAALMAQVILPRKYLPSLTVVSGAPTGVFLRKSFSRATKNHSRSRRIGPPKVAERIRLEETYSSGS